jgi:HAD superfamily hydrolase (TIGR01509 family)
MHRKIILLDLGGVVFQSSGVSDDIIKWDIINKLNHKYSYELNIGKDKFPSFLKEYNEQTNQHLSGQEFLKAVFDTLEINTELIEIVKENNDIIIVSDNYRENINYISQRFDFASWSINQIYSFDYQLEKSNPIFFQKLTAELDHYDKKEMLFIDDSTSKITSAEKSGIQGILFKNNNQIKEELKKYGR